mmetsp:Transcript_46698/g.137938  ORF Transcript_46698/g.137938 Transcript_46698/m.137938 type:complete len:807 (-) Transcript_46698:51-2471(-)
MKRGARRKRQRTRANSTRAPASKHLAPGSTEASETPRTSRSSDSECVASVASASARDEPRDTAMLWARRRPKPLPAYTIWWEGVSLLKAKEPCIFPIPGFPAAPATSGLLGLRDHLEQVLHLRDLELFVGLAGGLLVTLLAHDAYAQVRRQLERVDAAAVVSHNDDRLHGVERNVRELGALDHLLLADPLVAVDGEVVDVDDPAGWRRRSVGGDGREGRGGVGRPGDVADGLSQVEGHDGRAVGVVPHLDGPVRGRREEDLGMEGVPPDGVDSHGVPLVRLQVLAAERLGALVDAALLGAHQEEVLALRVEVEAEAAREPTERRLVVLSRAGVVAPARRHQLQLHDLLALQLVLHEEPVRDAAVGGDGEEVEGAARLVVVPAHLPDGVGVLVRADGALVDGPLHLRAHIVDEHGAVVEADGQDGGVARVPVQGADPRVRVEDVLGEARVLQRVAADHPGATLEEVVRAEADRDEVVVPRVPLDGRHLLALRLLGGEAPQGQQRALAVAELVAAVLPVLEVVVHLVLRVLVDHAFHDLDRELHVVRVDGRVGVGLLLLLAVVLVGLLGVLLDVLLLRSLNLSHVGVVDVPLRYSAMEAGGRRRLRGPAALAKEVVLRLRRAVAEVELIEQRVLLRLLAVVLGRVEVDVDGLLAAAALPLLLLLVDDLVLILRLGAVLEQDLAIHGEVHDALVDLVVLLEDVLLVGELGEVGRRARVGRVEDAGGDLLVQLLGAELQLVLGLHLDDHGHAVVVVHGVIAVGALRLGGGDPGRRRLCGGGFRRHFWRCSDATLGVLLPVPWGCLGGGRC